MRTVRKRMGSVGWFVLLFFFLLFPGAESRGQEGRSRPARGPEEPLANQVSITAAKQERSGDTIICTGSVEVLYKNIQIQADRMEIDLKNKECRAEGNVVIRDGKDQISGTKAEYNMDTQRGAVYNAKGFSQTEEIYFHGKKISKVGEDKYEIRHGDATPCNQPRPYWDFKASRMTYEADKYVRATNLQWRFKRVPFLYVPFVQYPAKRERSTGFLFPTIGFNDQRGNTFGDTFFWAINRSYDLTLSYEYMTKLGHEFDPEFHYFPADGVNGGVRLRTFFGTKGELSDTRMYAIRADHREAFGGGYYGTLAIDYRNDARIDTLLRNTYYRSTLSVIRSNGELSKRWPGYSLSVQGRDIRYESTIGETIQRDLPEVQFNRYARPLGGSPFVLDFLTSFDAISMKNPSDPKALEYMRADFAPRLSLPLKTLPWLQFTPSFSYRDTYYTKHRPPDVTSGVVDESLNRHYYQVELLLRGPMVAKVFGGSGTGSASKYKHVIEPEVRYNYTPSFDLHGEAIFYDTVDVPFQVNQVSFSLNNRFITKKKLGRSGGTMPYEFLTITLAQSFSLDPNLPASQGISYFSRRTVYPGQIIRTRTPLEGLARFRPAPGYDVTVRTSYDTESLEFVNWTVQGHLTKGKTRLNASWFRSPEILGLSSKQDHLMADGAISLAGERIEMTGGLSYNFITKTQENTYLRVKLSNQCIGFGAGFMKWSLPSRSDYEYRFTIWLKHIGNVLDYNFGDTGYQ
jgi:LPS-assembly protein